MKQSESAVKTAIKKYLEASGYDVYPINNGGTAIGGRSGKAGDKVRFAFHGKKGFPDLVALKKGQCVVYVKAKATGKEPSVEQAEFLALAESCKSTIAIWADSFSEFHVKFLAKKKGM